MPNPTEPADELPTTNGISTWDEVHQLADELDLTVHLLGMDARDQWRMLKPRLEALEQTLARTKKRASKAFTKELTAVRALLEKLVAEVPRSN